MAALAKSCVVCLFLLSILVVHFCKFATSMTTVDPNIKKMMEDMGRSVPDRCFTPPNLKSIFMRACEGVLNGNVTQCSFAWTAFRLGFGRKDPNSVNAESYNTYFAVLPIKSRANTAVYWSGSALKSIVEQISEESKISSSVNHISSRIINTMIKDDKVMCWCGNTTAFLDTVNPCPITPVVAFWQAFSSHFAESGRGIVYFITDGNRKGGVYQNASFFSMFEFSSLISDEINKLVVINIYDCNNNMVEKCGEGTLKLLENQTVSKPGRSVGYRCETVCGNATDKQQVFLLANHTLEIITGEQKRGGTYNYIENFIQCITS